MTDKIMRSFTARTVAFLTAVLFFCGEALGVGDTPISGLRLMSDASGGNYNFTNLNSLAATNINAGTITAGSLIVTNITSSNVYTKTEIDSKLTNTGEWNTAYGWVNNNSNVVASAFQSTGGVISGDVTIIGNTYLEGDAYVANLYVTNIWVTNLWYTITNLAVHGDGYITGSLSVSNGLSVTGGLFMGSASIDTNYNGFVINTNMNPSVSNTFSLGSSNMPWKDLYLGSNSIYMANTKVLSFSNGTLIADAGMSNTAGSTYSPTGTFLVITGGGAGITNLNASNLVSGIVSLSLLPSVVVTNNGTNLTLSGSFTGNGSGLTNLPVSTVNQSPLTNNLNGAGYTISNASFVGNGSGLTNLPVSTVNQSPLTNNLNAATYSITNLNGIGFTNGIVESSGTLNGTATTIRALGGTNYYDILAASSITDSTIVTNILSGSNTYVIGQGTANMTVGVLPNPTFSAITVATNGAANTNLVTGSVVWTNSSGSVGMNPVFASVTTTGTTGFVGNGVGVTNVGKIRVPTFQVENLPPSTNIVVTHDSVITFAFTNNIKDAFSGYDTNTGMYTLPASYPGIYVAKGSFCFGAGSNVNMQAGFWEITADSTTNLIGVSQLQSPSNGNLTCTVESRFIYYTGGVWRVYPYVYSNVYNNFLTNLPGRVWWKVKYEGAQ